MAVGVGVEPTSPESEPDVLPLDYPTMVLRTGIEAAAKAVRTMEVTYRFVKVRDVCLSLWLTRTPHKQKSPGLHRARALRKVSYLSP